MINEFMKSGREDLELSIRITRKDKYPIIKVEVEKKKGGRLATPCKKVER